MSIGSIKVTSPGWATFAYVALPGQATDGFKVGNYVTQTDVKTRWPDGSIQHALVCAKVEVGEWAIESGPKSGTPFVTTWPSVSVRFDVGGVLYTASFIGLGDRFRTGSQVVEAREIVSPVNVAGTVHPLLQAKFDVRAYRDGSARVWVTIQNVQDRIEGNRVDYDLVVTVNGQLVYSHAGVSHPFLTNPPLVFPVNLTEAQYTLDLEPFHKIGAFPRYTGTSQIAYDSTTPAFGYLGFGDFEPYMGGGGARPEIGLEPDWCARFIEHQESTTRAYMLAMANASGSFSGHLTEPDGQTLISIEQRPTYWFDWRAAQNGLDGPKSFNGTAWTPDGHAGAWLEKAHLPAPCYVPYLVTGDRFYLDQVKQWANYAILATYPEKPRTATTLWDPQVRGWAWGVRNVAQAALCTPDTDPDKGYFRRCVEKDLAYLDQHVAESTQGWLFLGYFGTDKHETGAPDPWTPPYQLIVKPWQYSYMVEAVDYARQLGMAGGHQIRDWLLKWFVSLFHTAGYPREYWGPYSLCVAEVLSGQMMEHARGYALLEAWQRTFSNGASPAANVHTAETHGPLVMAERLGLAGATEALTWLEAYPGLMADVAKRPGNGAFTRAGVVTEPLPLPTPAPPPPEPAPSLPAAPTVTMRDVTVVVVAKPPDTRTGWKATIRKDGVIVGKVDSSPPFERVVTVKPGSYQWDVIWKHVDGTSLTSAVNPTPVP